MANRKSLSAALNLSPEKLAFIHGTATPKLPDQLEQPSTAPESEKPSKAETSREPVSGHASPRPSRSHQRAGHLLSDNDESIVWISNLLVPLTTRLQPSTAAALKRASLEQKLRGQKPSTLQEIAEVALQQWLRDTGYLE